MNNIHKILVPTDFSKNANQALRYAVWFADKINAEIEICHFVFAEVIPGDVPVVSGELTQQKVETAKSIIKSLVESTLAQEHTTSAISRAPKISQHISIGPAATLIADYANEKHFDLIIMGTKGEHNIVQRLVGTITRSTINQSDCPVLVIPADSDDIAISKVAYASQVIESDPLHIWETKKLLQPFNCELHIINVMEKEGVDKELSLEDFMGFFGSDKEDVKLSFHTLYGDDHVSEIIEDYVDENGIDLLVMYKPNRSFFDRLFHKSLTKELVEEIEAPLLIIK